MIIDVIDRRIIQATQMGLPLTSCPYHTIAEQLDLPVEEVMVRLKQMLKNNIIRRIGAVPNHYALGYRINGMTVWDVRDDKVDELGQRIGKLEFVSHCYRRPRYLPIWPYNLFAMVHGKNQAQVDQQIQHIIDLLGQDNQGHDILYSTRILKKTGLRLSQDKSF